MEVTPRETYYLIIMSSNNPDNIFGQVPSEILHVILKHVNSLNPSIWSYISNYLVQHMTGELIGDYWTICRQIERCHLNRRMLLSPWYFRLTNPSQDSLTCRQLKIQYM